MKSIGAFATQADCTLQIAVARSQKLEDTQASHGPREKRSRACKGSYKKLDDELALVDHMSYYNEAANAILKRKQLTRFHAPWTKYDVER